MPFPEDSRIPGLAGRVGVDPSTHTYEYRRVDIGLIYRIICYGWGRVLLKCEVNDYTAHDQEMYHGSAGQTSHNSVIGSRFHRNIG